MNPNKRFVISLTWKEYLSLSSIVQNGWACGEYSGWGGDDNRTQVRALAKFGKPKEVSRSSLRLLKGQEIHLVDFAEPYDVD